MLNIMPKLDLPALLHVTLQLVVVIVVVAIVAIVVGSTIFKTIPSFPSVTK
jgi:hypothetical protein